MDIPSVRSQLRREAVNNDTSTHGNLIIDGAMSNAQNHNKTNINFLVFLKIKISMYSLALLKSKNVA